MPDDSSPSKNPFVRWKQQVDAHIGMTLNRLLGIPTIVSKNMNLRRDGDGEPSTTASASASTASSTSPACSDSAASSLTPASSSPPDEFDANQLLAWHRFIYYSPYSPLKLQQLQDRQRLPPPIPQESLPLGTDPYAFTYADAFEDLLRASQDRPLINLAARSFQNVRYQMRYGSAAEPPYLFFHRMHRQRLLDAYFPRGEASHEPNQQGAQQQLQPQYGPAVYSGNGQGFFSDDDDEATAFDLFDEEEDEDDQDEEDADDEFPIGGGNTGNGWPWSALGIPKPRPGALFDELDRVFRVLGRIIDENTGAADNRAASSPNDTNTPPRAEDERLYQMVRSAYADAEKSLSSLIRAVARDNTRKGDGGKGGENAGEEPVESVDHVSSAEPTGVCKKEVRTTDENQIETICTTEEHTDIFGNHHTKVVVRRLGPDGREISNETRYSVRSQSSWPRPEADKKRQDSQDGKVEDKAKDGSLSKPAGWFWK